MGFELLAIIISVNNKGRLWFDIRLLGVGDLTFSVCQMAYGHPVHNYAHLELPGHTQSRRITLRASLTQRRRAKEVHYESNHSVVEQSRGYRFTVSKFHLILRYSGCQTFEILILTSSFGSPVQTCFLSSKQSDS